MVLASLLASVLGAVLVHAGCKLGPVLQEVLHALQQRHSFLFAAGLLLVKITLSKTLLAGKARKLHLERQHFRPARKMHTATQIPPMELPSVAMVYNFKASETVQCVCVCVCTERRCCWRNWATKQCTHTEVLPGAVVVIWSGNGGIVPI